MIVWSYNKFDKMKFKFKNLIYLLLLNGLSCQDSQKGKTISHQNLRDRVNGVSNYKPEAINGILDINKDSIIIIKHLELLLSENGGKTWHDIGRGQFIEQLTVDNNNTLWGLSSGGGIHEKRIAVFFRSKDWGKTWEQIKLDANNFFPSRIISRPHEPLNVVNYENKIYKLDGDNPQINWHYIDDLTNPNLIIAKTTLAQYLVNPSNGSNLTVTKKTSKGSKVILKTLMSGDINSIVAVKDTLFIAGNTFSKEGYSKAYFAELINDSILKNYEINGNYADVIKGIGNRIWIITKDVIYLKVGERLVKFYHN